MIREEAYQLLTKYLKNPNLIKHSFAAEAAMKALCHRLSKPDDEETWGITGLLHDADYEMSRGMPEKHGLLLFEKEKNIPDDIAHAIKAHNFEYTKVLPETQMDWAIACADQLTGLIVAATLVHPDKKLSAVTADFVMGRYKDNSFAKGANRESIERCEKYLQIPLTEFIDIVLKSMQGISDVLGL